MFSWEKIRWKLVGFFGKRILWLWSKSTRMKVIGEEQYKELRAQKKPVIILIWHGRIFIVPYFFRKRQIMPLVSPSQDGEIPARIMEHWGYKILRGSSSHSIFKAWNQMKKELLEGGEVILVPDGPRGPDRELKMGCIKLAQETGAYLVPFTFSTSRKKFLESWDHFLMFYPFSRVVAMYGEPIAIPPPISKNDNEKLALRMQNILNKLDKEADQYFS